MFSNDFQTLKRIVILILISMAVGTLFFTFPISILIDGTMRVPRSIVISAMLGANFGALLVAKRNFEDAVLMNLLMLFAVPFYQLAIMESAPPGASWFRILPMLLMFPIFFVCYPTMVKSKPIVGALTFIWVILNIPAIAQSIDTINTTALYIVAVFMPILIFAALFYTVNLNNINTLIQIVFLGFITTIILSISSLSLEQGYKETDAIIASRNLADLNQVIGGLILLWPVLLKGLEFYNKKVRYIFWILVILMTVFSYSRGGIIAITLLIMVSYLRLGVFIVPIAIGFIYMLVENPFNSQLIHFWALRFNLTDLGSGGTIDQKIATLFSTDRSYIWEITWKLAEESKFIGIGLGRLSENFSFLTFGRWQFKGSHNLLLTVLAERGLLVALFILIVFIVILILYFLNLFTGNAILKRIGWLGFTSFIMFIFYSHTVGVELIYNSSRIVNAQTPYYLFVNLLYLVYVRKSWRNNYGP
jgi:hypothetical protein